MRPSGAKLAPLNRRLGFFALYSRDYAISYFDNFLFRIKGLGQLAAGLTMTLPFMKGWIEQRYS
jgi:hypothetical protein